MENMVFPLTERLGLWMWGEVKSRRGKAKPREEVRKRKIGVQ